MNYSQINDGAKLVKDENNSTFHVVISNKLLRTCLEADRIWDIDFRKFIASEYPYTMSPETTKYIAQATESIKFSMSQYGFQINSWDKGYMGHEPYVMGVLRRVCVPDTFEPIFDNTDKMICFLEELAKNVPNRMFHIRSFFTGAAVAEKCLLSRLVAKGLKDINLITTDNSAESVAVAALNLEVWNQTLPNEDRYSIHIVNGKIPIPLFTANRTIVLQIGDALQCSIEDCQVNPKYDALLLDNGLPYLRLEYGVQIIKNVVRNKGRDGLIIAALGLDANIKVEISTITHMKNIAKALKSDTREDPRIGVFQAPYNYPHYYDYVVSEDGNILINQVISDGSGRMYNWLAYLVKTNIRKLFKILEAIKSATELSRVKNAVITTPFDSHCSMIKLLETNNIKYTELEKPLDYEKFGWIKMDDDQFLKEGRSIKGEEMMKLCRVEDRLVLRKSIIRIFR